MTPEGIIFGGAAAPNTRLLQFAPGKETTRRIEYLDHRRACPLRSTRIPERNRIGAPLVSVGKGRGRERWAPIRLRWQRSQAPCAGRHERRRWPEALAGRARHRQAGGRWLARPVRL